LIVTQNPQTNIATDPSFEPSSLGLPSDDSEERMVAPEHTATAVDRTGAREEADRAVSSAIKAA
jgi:hypothetical protein